MSGIRLLAALTASTAVASLGAVLLSTLACIQVTHATIIDFDTTTATDVDEPIFPGVRFLGGAPSTSDSVSRLYSSTIGPGPNGTIGLHVIFSNSRSVIRAPLRAFLDTPVDSISVDMGDFGGDQDSSGSVRSTSTVPYSRRSM